MAGRVPDTWEASQDRGAASRWSSKHDALVAAASTQ